MSIWSAVIFRLFAGGDQRKRTIWVRICLFGMCLIGLAWLIYRMTPTSVLPSSTLQHSALLWVVVCTLVTAVFMVGHGPQLGFLARLKVLDVVALPGKQILMAQCLACAPLVLVAGALTLPMVFKAFGLTLAQPTMWFVTVVAWAVTTFTNILLRISTSRTNSLAQFISSIALGCGVVLGWFLVQPSHGHTIPIILSMLLLLGQLWLIFKFLFDRPTRTDYESRTTFVRERKRLTLIGAYFLRASRNARYLGANALLLLAAAGLSAVAWWRPAYIPFDAVVVGVLLLAGTFGQEARTLSSRHLPVELVFYDAFIQWLSAVWLVALGNTALFASLLIVAGGSFAGSLSVSYLTALCTALCLAGAGTLAGSLIVPRKDDILAQFASTALYAGLAWLVLQLSGIRPGMLLLVTAGIIGLCLGVSCISEHLRWMLTVRGRHATHL